MEDFSFIVIKASTYEYLRTVRLSDLLKICNNDLDLCNDIVRLCLAKPQRDMVDEIWVLINNK